MPTTTIDNKLHHVTNGRVIGQIGTTNSDVTGQNGFRTSVDALLGKTVRLSEHMSRGDLDLYQGPNHSTTGIPYAIHGTATVIEQRVGVWLAGFDDPIKAILPVQVEKNGKVIVRRKYVVGGSATITPERAPARTVAVREEEREILLTRYGSDIEMNLNLFLKPEAAREELEMKLEAQREELEKVMIQIGYETVMRDGVNVMEALARANPAMAHLSTLDRQIAVEKTYIHSIFGCINKHPYPVENLLAAASKANLYTPAGSSRDGMAVMIVPPGMMDLSKFTRESEMNFSVSGLTAAEHGKLSMPLSNVVEDRVSNLKIMVHIPAPNNHSGAAYPEVSTNGLMNVASWGTYYPLDLTDVLKAAAAAAAVPAVPAATSGGVATPAIPATPATPAKDARYDLDNMKDTRITDFRNRAWGKLDIKKACAAYAKIPGYADYFSDEMPKIEKGNEEVELIVVRPRFSAMMQSAILSTPASSDAGNLLMAYPQTGVSTSQTTESMKMQLRVYLGAGVYQPDHFIILPDVAFAGAISGHGTRMCESGTFKSGEHDLILAFKSKSFDGASLLEDDHFLATAGKTFYKGYAELFDKTNITSSSVEERDIKMFGSQGEGVPLTFHQGRVERCYDGRWETMCRNFGHLGALDDPEMSDQIDGLQKYQAMRTQ